MRRAMACIMSAVFLTASLAAAPARADTEEGPGGPMWGVLVVVMTAVGAANVIKIAEGDGSAVLGAVGAGMGAATALVFFDQDETLLVAVSALTAVIGLASMSLAYAPRKPQRVSVAPTVSSDGYRVSLRIGV